MANCIIHESAQFGDVSIQKRNPNTIEFITVLQEANKSNRNGRIYPKAVLEKALNAPNVSPNTPEICQFPQWYLAHSPKPT